PTGELGRTPDPAPQPGPDPDLWQVSARQRVPYIGSQPIPTTTSHEAAGVGRRPEHGRVAASTGEDHATMAPGATQQVIMRERVNPIGGLGAVQFGPAPALKRVIAVQAQEVDRDV